MNDTDSASHLTPSGLRVHHLRRSEAYSHAAEPLRLALDRRRGVLLTSSFEYPGRYTRWDIGFVDPPLLLQSSGRELELRALNDRGLVLLAAAEGALQTLDALAEPPRRTASQGSALRCVVREREGWFPEEQRSRQPTVFSVVRALVAAFGYDAERHLGLYGAFGYELAFQFESIRLRQQRRDERDLVLYLPDAILTVDHRTQQAITHLYDFDYRGATTRGLPRDGEEQAYAPAIETPDECDHAPGEYAQTVREAIDCFRRGDLFEVVPSQTFFEACPAPPSELFHRLRQRNPAPYGALMNLGEAEYLVAASPEMFVRVDGRRIETCPISGTIQRGRDAIEDADNILQLLTSEKETSELTMCTDVDRNDKSRVCEAGSVTVIGRRQIEMYSRLIHTVDHVEGMLRPEFDALDGFLAHTWAVTVTGAPKQHAIQFIEDYEHSPRRWYGGAMGCVGFDGNMNTGLTLRTVRVKDGIAEVRAGATLLFESDPDAEERETRLKASALLDAIRRGDDNAAPAADVAPRPGRSRRVFMVDHEDSFVHTLAGYFRQTGAEVVTYRSGFPMQELDAQQPDLVLLSPGPGRPSDFALPRSIDAALERGIPLFGVCLGLQGIVEYFGGTLDVLDRPMHGKPSEVEVLAGTVFEGLPRRFRAGRYHSLFARRADLPEVLRITAQTEDGLIMGIEHRELPIAAVQFHPESIMTLAGDVGLALVRNVMRHLPAR
jgi:anthranilate synthase